MEEPLERVRTSARETDELAERIFALLRGESIEAKRLILDALLSRQSRASTDRVAVVRRAIERYETETGEPLSKRRYESWRVASGDKSLPSATFISNSFGRNWSGAMSALGKEPSLDHAAYRLRARGQSPSDEEVLAAIARCAAETGAVPFRFADYRAWALEEQSRLPENELLLISPSSFIRRFGSFRGACLMAGVNVEGGRGPRGPSRRIDEGTIIDVLRRASSETGLDGNLTSTTYEKWRQEQHHEASSRGEWLALPSVGAMRSRFGDWPSALEAAGIITSERARSHARGRGQVMTVEQVVDGILRASAILGWQFSIRQYRIWRVLLGDKPDEARAPSVSVVRRHAGSWTRLHELLALAREATDPRRALIAAIEETADDQ